MRSGDLKPQLVYRADVGEYLSSFSSDNAGKVFACVRENNATPPQIAVIDAVTKPVRPIVDLNPGFSMLQKGSTERLDGKNSYGENWFAYLVKPLDFVPGMKYPLIVTTYRSGDYFLRGASGDENPIQVYPAHGFVVLCVDVGWTRPLGMTGHPAGPRPSLSYCLFPSPCSLFYRRHMVSPATVPVPHPTPEAEEIYRRWIRFLDEEFLRDSSPERRAEIVRDQLYQLYLGCPHGGKLNLMLTS